jgi:hypothetical protein
MLRGAKSLQLKNSINRNMHRRMSLLKDLGGLNLFQVRNVQLLIAVRLLTIQPNITLFIST